MRLVDKLVIKDLIGPFINGLLMFMLLIFAAAYMFPATEEKPIILLTKKQDHN